MGKRETGIDELPSGSYRARVRTPDGQRLTKTFPTRKEAAAWKAAQARALRDGANVSGSRQRAAAYLDEWVEAHAATKAPRTAHQYRDHVRRILTPALGDLTLGRLDVPAIEAAYARMASAGQSAAMVGKAAVTLGVALEAARRARLIPANPARDARRPRVERGARAGGTAWTREQRKAFVAACDGHRLEALFVLWLDTGMRPGEIFALRWGRVDLPNRAVTVAETLDEIDGRLTFKATAKTRKSLRTLPISQTAADALGRLTPGDAAALVFTDTEGKPLRVGNVRRRDFLPLVAKAGVPVIRLYDLRHTAITRDLKATRDPVEVARKAGHSTVTLTLNTYGHALDADARRMADLVDDDLR